MSRVADAVAVGELTRHNDEVVPFLWLALFAPPQMLHSADLRCSTGPAFIIEKRLLREATEARSLALWMCDPRKYEDEVYDNVYTCPDQTRGRFYRGQTWLSLIDEKTKQVLNTIPILSD